MSASRPGGDPEQSCHWVFGYGSLIYKVDFPYLEREEASLSGWQRRFWQGSHDHRGTPCSPGRVVTLVRSPGALCLGIAYRVAAEVLEQLDYREKNGYQRYACPIHLRERGATATGVVYIATRQNPAYLGPARTAAVADHIAGASGPSGSNTEYVLRLADALRALGDHDEHVMGLETLLLARVATGPGGEGHHHAEPSATTRKASENLCATTRVYDS